MASPMQNRSTVSVILLMSIAGAACAQNPGHGLRGPIPIKKTETETAGGGTSASGTGGSPDGTYDYGYSGDGPMSEAPPPNQSLADTAPADPDDEDEPPWSYEPAAGPSAENPGESTTNVPGPRSSGSGGGSGQAPATASDPRVGTKPGQISPEGEFIPIPGCPEVIPPGHDGHEHETLHRYTPYEVCEDERCVKGMEILACIKLSQDEYRNCNKSAVNRRVAGQRSPLAADRAEAARCQGKRHSYTPVRFWEQYYREMEVCHQGYDVAFRACVGTWELHVRPPRLHVGPTAPLPIH